jgi:hypothetical protein
MAQGDTNSLETFLEEKRRNPAFKAYIEHMLEDAEADIALRKVILGELLNLALFPPTSSHQAVTMLLRALSDEDLPVAVSRFNKRHPGVFQRWGMVLGPQFSVAWKAWGQKAASKLAQVYLMEGKR